MQSFVFLFFIVKVIFFGVFFGQVRGNLGKNPSHPQKFACSSTPMVSKSTLHSNTNPNTPAQRNTHASHKPYVNTVPCSTIPSKVSNKPSCTCSARRGIISDVMVRSMVMVERSRVASMGRTAPGPSQVRLDRWAP